MSVGEVGEVEWCDERRGQEVMVIVCVEDEDEGEGEGEG